MKDTLKKNILYRTAAALTAIVLMIPAALPSFAVADIKERVPEMKADKFTVMALGDDMINGAGLSSPQNERLSAVLAADIGGHDSAWGVSGGTASSLLAALNTGVYDEMLKNASYIIVDAGVNDFLIPFVAAADDALAAAGFKCTLADFITDVYGQRTDSEVYKNSGELLKTIASSLNYSSSVWEAVGTYNTNVSAIIKYLNLEAPQAQIFMLNIWNPFTFYGALQAGDYVLDLKGLTDKYITNMNASLNRHKYVGWTNVTVIDANETLAQSGNTQTPAETKKARPMPTKAGHAALKQVIADEIDYPVMDDVAGHGLEEDIRRIAAWRMCDDIIYDRLFYPDSGVTRGDWAYMVCRLVGGQSSWFSNQSGLNDVKNNDTRRAEIYWAYSQRLITGKNSSVGPDTVITREELATLAVRFINLYKFEPETDSSLPRIADLEEAEYENQYYIDTAVHMKLFDLDRENKFNPKKAVTRGEICSFLLKLEGMTGCYHIVSGV